MTKYFINDTNDTLRHLRPDYEAVLEYRPKWGVREVLLNMDAGWVWSTHVQYAHFLSSFFSDLYNYVPLLAGMSLYNCKWTEGYGFLQIIPGNILPKFTKFFCVWQFGGSSRISIHYSLTPCVHDNDVKYGHSGQLMSVAACHNYKHKKEGWFNFINSQCVIICWLHWLSSYFFKSCLLVLYITPNTTDSGPKFLMFG